MKTATQHTQGEWVAVQQNWNPVLIKPMEVKIDCDTQDFIYVSGENREANAKLIAAAPKLLDVLVQYFDLMSKAEEETHFEHLLQEYNWNNKAKQAIKKATE